MIEDHGGKKEPVPRVTDHVYSAPKMNRNFIHWNALSQMRAAPPEKNDPKLVDAPNGNSQILEKSGLKPKFALKKVYWMPLKNMQYKFLCQDFGRVPTYLNRMKMEAAEAARLWEAEQEAERNRKEAMILTQEERDNILQVYNYKIQNDVLQKSNLFFRASVKTGL